MRMSGTLTKESRDEMIEKYRKELPKYSGRLKRMLKELRELEAITHFLWQNGSHDVSGKDLRRIHSDLDLSVIPKIREIVIIFIDINK